LEKPAHISLAISLVAILIFGFFASEVVASRYLRTKFIRAVAWKCPACQLEIGKVSVKWVPAKITAESIKFQGDPASDTLFVLIIDRIAADI
jgi:hypothetical protein